MPIVIFQWSLATRDYAGCRCHHRYYSMYMYEYSLCHLWCHIQALYYKEVLCYLLFQQKPWLRWPYWKANCIRPMESCPPISTITIKFSPVLFSPVQFIFQYPRLVGALGSSTTHHQKPRRTILCWYFCHHTLDCGFLPTGPELPDLQNHT